MEAFDSVLNCGDVPDLYASEDFEAVATFFVDMRKVAVLKVHRGIIVFLDLPVVAVAGGCSYDAPTLKLSDVGFAMGISGTRYAKDAADDSPLGDIFAGIVTAAKWGPACL